MAGLIEAIRGTSKKAKAILMGSATLVGLTVIPGVTNSAFEAGGQIGNFSVVGTLGERGPGADAIARNTGRSGFFIGANNFGADIFIGTVSPSKELPMGISLQLHHEGGASTVTPPSIQTGTGLGPLNGERVAQITVSRPQERSASPLRSEASPGKLPQRQTLYQRA